MTFRAILKSAISSQDNLVRRTSCQAMGCLTSIVGGKFARRVLRSLVSGVKTKTPSPSLRAGTSFALACHYRASLSTTNNTSTSTTISATISTNISTISPAAAAAPSTMHSELPELDSILYDSARETREPVRTSALHSWWVMLSSQHDLTKYIKPTLALVDAHLLTPDIGLPRGSTTATDAAAPLDHLTYPVSVIIWVTCYYFFSSSSFFSYFLMTLDDLFLISMCTYLIWFIFSFLFFFPLFFFPKKDRDDAAVARSVKAGVLSILGKMMNTLMEGMGDGLERWSTSSAGNKRHFSLMWSAWMVLRCSPDESVTMESIQFILHLADYHPRALFHDSKFSTLVVPWLDSLLRGREESDLIDLTLAYQRVGMTPLPCLSSLMTSTSATTYAMRWVWNYSFFFLFIFHLNYSF